MKRKHIIISGLLLLFITRISAQGIVLDEGKPNDGNMGYIVKKFTDNPAKDNLVQSNFVFRLTKNSGENSKNWHGLEINQKVKLTPESHTLELYVFFPLKDNPVKTTTLALWMGTNKSGEIKQTITAMDKWQKVLFDYSVLPEFRKVFGANRDTTFSRVIFLPRREDDKQHSINLYIDKLVFAIRTM